MGSGPSRRTRDLVLRRSRGRCERCSILVDTWHVHHRKPRRMGGRGRNSDINAPANLMILCTSCHSHIESQRDDAIAWGYLIRETDDPAKVPVLVGGRRWVLLAGEYTDEWV